MSDAALTTTRPRFRRRQFFVEKRLQGSFLLRFVAGVAAAAVLAGGSVYILLGDALEREMFSAHFSLSHSGDLVRPYLLSINICVALLLLGIALIAIVRTLQRYTAALKRIRGGIERMSAGDLTVALGAKSGDHLDGLFYEVNLTISEARERAAAAQQAVEKAVEPRSKEIDIAAELRRCAGELRRIADGARSSRFKVQS